MVQLIALFFVDQLKENIKFSLEVGLMSVFSKLGDGGCATTNPAQGLLLAFYLGNHI